MTPAGPPLRLTPFRATTYAAGTDLAAVVCPPYDVIGDRALAEFEAHDPHNIVHLTLPRALPGDDRYAGAARALREWRAAGVLRRDPAPALYVYEHVTTGGATIGLVGGVGLDGPVLPHENTFPGPVADRAALMHATRMQLEPILLTYDGGGAASEVVDHAAGTEPHLEFTVAGETHRIWRVDQPGPLAAIAADLAGRTALIADGHHRFAAYRAVHAAGPVPHATDHGLALLVDAARHPLELRGIHRSVAGLALDEAAAAAAKGFDVVDLAADVDPAAALDGERGTAFVIGDGQRQVLLRSPRPSVLADAVPAGRPDGWDALDAAVLVDVLLAYLWGVDDADPRVTYHHDGRDSLRAAARDAGIAVLVRPPALADVLALAARGERMPRKSTSFGPKPWTGLLMRDLTPDHH
ncbi:DUF1015 domain-containing protein [Jiangella rhizosphaerae]|uniref:DUF1015 domain-containing protein n=1 Tax=Jiangella rhizosphaerae TaxID=2293569 RepID=A0A418KKE3_9ACTN|nr:DUF1015 domain-containing protein [Jiangella rhizosphaerae]RIQ16045.1 DUF1015 domain-containing protein [Jiangella rhizosphaerae]